MQLHVYHQECCAHERALGTSSYTCSCNVLHSNTATLVVLHALIMLCYITLTLSALLLIMPLCVLIFWSTGYVFASSLSNHFFITYLRLLRSDWPWLRSTRLSSAGEGVQKCSVASPWIQAKSEITHYEEMLQNSPFHSQPHSNHFSGAHTWTRIT